MKGRQGRQDGPGRPIGWEPTQHTTQHPDGPLGPS